MTALLGRLTVLMAVVWAATLMGTAVAAKASDDYIWILLVMITGFGLSSTLLGSTQRAALSLERGREAHAAHR
ncbi:hypothetical protein ACI3EY_06840 [Ornithinimicrobium sp. LYQ92]|uniref:hypothetical protein n=1 Tax=Serinicoccus sp. LYQ92 TaxID=3378798 RepID=UPI003853F372